VQTPLSFADILHHPHFQATVEALAQKAHTALPLADGRIEKAGAIVLSGVVTLHPDGHAVVASQRRPHTSYSINGTCGCALRKQHYFK
jgi:hypothetical protein